VRETPFVHVLTFLPFSLCPELLAEDLARQSLYAVLEGKCGLAIARGHRTFEAVAANARQAELLQVDRGAPLVMLDSVSFLDDGTPVEYYRAFHRGDMSRFEVELIRAPGAADVHRVLAGTADGLPRSNSLVEPLPGQENRGDGSD
jgi:GntR family transcriptional regulator